MLRFKFLNIPVEIHPSFWLFLLFFTNLYRDFSIESLLLAAVVILSLLVHEYGHAWTAFRFGARPVITLEAFGGNAQYNGFGLTPKQHFLITLNGPLLESVLIVLAYSLLKGDFFSHNYYLRYLLYATLRVNILWCLLNLIPIAPLDGGLMLRYLFEKRFGQKGSLAAITIGLISVALLVPYLYFQGFFFFGTLLFIFGFQYYQLLRTHRLSAGRSHPFKTYTQGLEAIKNQDTERAKWILKKLLKSKDVQIKHLATESLAKIYLQENEEQKSYDLLLKADPHHLKEGKALLCKLAFANKNYELVVKYSRELYEMNPSFEIALLNSQAFACLNRPELSGAWLKTAARFDAVSEETIQELLKKPFYDSVRNQEAFKLSHKNTSRSAHALQNKP
ncbi:MAG TPA: hypothetical protein DCY54_02260 [Parachlamydiales bacterium]|nr:MAG: hypothetical protein A3G30_00105 [Chlamydiae bacterium RIFCSPLOWO2_12_FULL_49_12]HAZ15452.1 hypothetical protein [Parachlamydiales bacterium]